MDANLYTQTLQGQRSVDVAATAVEGNLDELAGKLQEQYDSVAVDGEDVPNARLQLEFELRLLKRSKNTIGSKDQYRKKTLGARIDLRDDRDEQTVFVCDHLVALARKVKARYGPRAVRLFGLEVAPNRRDAAAALAYARNVHGWLLAPDPSLVPRFGLPHLDFEALAAELWDVLSVLDGGLTRHLKSAETAADASTERRKVMKDEDRFRRSILWRLVAACRLVGFDALALRLRPPKRTASNDGTSDGDPPNDGTPNDGRTPDAPPDDGGNTTTDPPPPSDPPADPPADGGDDVPDDNVDGDGG